MSVIPRRAYGDPITPSYFDFKNLHAKRQAVVYIGGNDGMLHAFDATNGEEMWALCPAYGVAAPVQIGGDRLREFARVLCRWLADSWRCV